MSKRLYLLISVSAAVVALATSCGGNKAKITGNFVGLDSHSVYLEQVGAYGAVIIDSTITDDKGKFKFKVELPASQPMIYNLKVDENVFPLFISPGEKVVVSSIYGNSRRYSVEGSEESALVKEINDILLDGMYRLDSIAASLPLYETDEAARRSVVQAYTREYHRVKREQIRFIVEHSGSLASIYALYQRLPGDDALFSGDNDIVYYRMVAEAAEKRYPGSPYLASLKSVINNFDASEELIRQLNEQMENPVPFPDIKMPDIYNANHSLSDELGKVILLDFWLAGDTQASVVNAEYKIIYDIYSRRGFEIYQVNVGTSKQAWVNAVLDQNLPWVSVSDLKGPSSPATMIYNVNQVPANYLISADGSIVAKDIFGDQLIEAVDRLTR